ncbi:MAG: SDR family oxidoreductase [Planctomycetaceae bacterium]|nr:SDR family oxidoreductase [Planctomycetaceae bacterium]
MPQLPDREPTIAELFSLRGRSALITGGSGHLGSAMSRALAEAGASVVVASRTQAKAQAFAETLPRPFEQSHYGVALDHVDEASRQAGFDEAVRLTGGLDVLVNNAVTRASAAHDWTNVTAGEFDEHLRNNTAYFMLARQMRDHALSRTAPASIVMIGSMYGVVGSYPDAYAGVSIASAVQYHALKGGTVHLTRHLAVYWAADGVRVNCLSPGPFPIPNGIPAEMERRLVTKTPLQRMGLPHELKGALILLASDAGSYLTGQNLLVDGGWTAW